MSCSIRSSVTSGGSESSSSVRRSRSPRERPEAGSSSIISFGSVALAMPTSSWRCWPCESEPTERVQRVGQPARARPRRGRARAARARGRQSARPQPAAVAPDDREVEVVLDRRARGRAGTSGTCGRRPACGRMRAGRLVTSVPIRSIVPLVGWKSPAMRLNSVVLPAPFGPRIARRSPCATSRSTSRTACTPPKRRPTPRKRRIEPALSAATGAVASVNA